MPKAGFNRDAKAFANILHNDPGVIAAVDAGVQEVFGNLSPREQESAFISEPFHTDRYVRALVVPADEQAKHGTATRAGQKAAK